MQVFAKAEYRLDRTPSVAGDTEFVAGYSSIPSLFIKLKNNVIDADRDLTFRLSLENAEWQDNSGNLIRIDSRPGVGGTATTNGNYQAVLNTSKGSITFNVTRISVTVIELSYASAIGADLEVDDEITIPMYSRVTNTGDVTVTIDPRDSILSGGTYTYAVASDGDTKTTVSKITDMHNAVTILETIMIDEVKPGAIKATSGGNAIITLKTPAGFVFLETMLTVRYSGGLAMNGAAAYQISPTVSKDGEEMMINLGAISSSSSTRGSILIDNVSIKPEDDDTKYGDIALQISGAGITKEKFMVAEYKAYGLTFAAEDKTLPILLVGRFEGSSPSNADAHLQDTAKTLKVHLEENVEQSWWGGRNSEIKMLALVKLRAVEITNAKNLMGYTGKTTRISINSDINEVYPNDGVNAKGNNIGGTNASITVEDDKVIFSNIYVADGKKASFDIQFWVSLEPYFNGDLAVSLTGPAVAEDISAVVASLIPPVAVDVKTTDVKIGYANIPVNDIVIKENQAGAILKSSLIANLPENFFVVFVL